MADCTSNPYLATATVLQAARLGVTEGYELPPEETGDCFETVNTKRCVPENLCAALEALESDQSLVDAIGQPIVDHLTYLKRVEWNKYLGHTTDWEMGIILNSSESCCLAGISDDHGARQSSADGLDGPLGF